MLQVFVYSHLGVIVLRIYFTRDDVARTRIAPAPDPLWELVMGLHMLRPQPGDLLFRDWRRTATAAIRQAALGDRLRLLLALTPPVGYYIDDHGVRHEVADPARFLVKQLPDNSN